MKTILHQGGGTESWAKEFWPRIYRFIYYKIQNKEEAEELTQEVFQRVFHKINDEKIRGLDEAKMQAYVFKIARNLLIDLWRKRGRQPGIVSLSGLQAQGWDLPQQTKEVEEALMVQQAMAQLSPDYRKVLIWRIVQGWSVEKVAQKMKRSPGAIRSLQYRAVRALKEQLERGGYFDGA
ncbi:MAG: RNA polymerase sigma factor [Dethiobacteria bacterium]